MSGPAPCALIARTATGADGRWLRGLWRREWGGLVMIAGGRALALADLEALVAVRGRRRVGAATYLVEGERAELVSLNALAAGRGVGSALLAATAERARAAGARRLEVFTTNDNVAALAFYQRRGLRLVEVRLGAVDAARELKPTVPLVGEGGVPVHDEWRLVLPLEPPPAPG